jgi:lysozyme family protein
MNNFDYAIAKVLENEGSYSFNPSDPGGETYCGISRVSWPNWSGWAIIDTYKDDSSFPKNLTAVSGLSDLVKSFYRTNFWHFDGIENPDVAEKVLDIWVNLPPERAAKVTQAALRSIEYNVSVDGQYGPATESAINQANPTTLLLELRAQQCYHYATNSKPVFLLGLLRRAVK